ncbi:unnamed protein product [Parnassius apollo]|uniref:(apollo) hypothetical protein n=1 Tax=Parnassius apollo TaxID=110799 RepID=A0A8S3WT30_PARAO|nr:unnamed protein product [Parnassius apollo]
MDNASYHSRRQKKIPVTSWKKPDIQELLSSKHISFEAKETKVQLLEKVNGVKTQYQSYVVDEMAKAVGCLYARLICLRQEEGDSTYTKDSYAAQVLSGNHSLPAPIEAYIKAIGNVVDNSAIRYKLRMPAWPNEDGHFGRVDFNSHWKYMSMPCPLVCRRIQEDLRITAVPGVCEWNLPEGLRSAEADAGNPTRNCLGWARASTLTNDQVAFLESANIMEDAFPVKFAQFQYNTDLFEKISLALSKTEQKIKLTPQTKKNAEGALAQQRTMNDEDISTLLWRLENGEVSEDESDLDEDALDYYDNVGELEADLERENQILEEILTENDGTAPDPPLIFDELVENQPHSNATPSLRDLIWKKKNLDLVDQAFTFLGCTDYPPIIMNLSTPYQYFSYFFDESLLARIVTESNKYAIQKNINFSEPMTVLELRKYIGILIYTSVYHYPSIRSYWANNISRLERVCAACWRSATRELQRRDQQDSNRPGLSEAILPDVGSSSDLNIPEPPPLPQQNLHTTHIRQIQQLSLQCISVRLAHPITVYLLIVLKQNVY